MNKTNEIESFKYITQGLDKDAIKRSMAILLEYAVGKDLYTATTRDWFTVSALVTRDRLVERWMETMRTYYHADAKRVYYLSLEFLIGRTLSNSLLNMEIHDNYREALLEIGLEMETIRDQEPDAGLGNGGLGRLAACFLDSMATLGIPGYGYGIRYEYGIFSQRIERGTQVEHPENWLRYGNPWEFPRPEVLYPVKFFGRVVEYKDDKGARRSHWIDTEQVMAMAYDTPIPGYKTNTVNNMRLWSAKATRDFDLKYFNEGNYIKAVEDKNISEDISKVLYPDDTTQMGRELRLKQQYFFVSASLQDILFRYQKHYTTFDALPDKVAIQLNDTSIFTNWSGILHGRSLAKPSPIPTTPYFPKRWRPGQWRLWRSFCRVTCNLFTKLISAFSTKFAMLIRGIMTCCDVCHSSRRTVDVCVWLISQWWVATKSTASLRSIPN
ncbi:MAG: Phosphorylase [Halothiobacillaceae bacterium]|nr:MAG: Phosphorylase [Halothiobacillaceae bacterium]